MMKRCLSLISLIIFLLSACSTPDRITATPTTIPATPTVPAPVFINHEQPDVKLDVTAFDKADCPLNQYGFRKCEKDSPLYALGCDFIEEPSSLLGALKPTHPIMLCVTFRDNIGDDSSDIYTTLKNRCDSAPDEVCADVNGIIGQHCKRTQSGICEIYKQKLTKKCTDPSVNICDPLDGFMAVHSEVHEKFEDSIEHLSSGYTYHPDGTYLFNQGGLVGTYYRYIIFLDFGKNNLT